ncbi:ATP-binding protein [Oceanivirga miroungae]|uniref:ATPase n=1 Tax=Oceanivirga miroungae TaxID=1130046 RepID=A0A6I8MC31_9FUSO|nr:hypothetical protein OMES3154_01087 [Oceanivirga miroungae]
MEKLINRPNYLNQLIENKDIDLIKIITGIRRSGKSSLLQLFYNYLLEIGVNKKNIIHINFESLKYSNLKDYLDLYNYIKNHIENDDKIYLLFDEIQVISNFEKALESFRLDFNCDIYMTGSNAYMLSSEFSTLISGRYIEIKMLPLSFKEFLKFYNFDKNISKEEKFQNYLQIGGMPILHKLGDLKRINQTLEGIYSTIVLKDILQRNSQIDHSILSRLILFICSNIGNITINKYMQMLAASFFIYPISRYDIKGKNLLKTLGKNYIVDIGFRNLLLGYRNMDRGHILENIVFLELMRREYKVYIGKINDLEIDFIAETPQKKMYIQVSETLIDEKNRERELNSLFKIKDNYEKIILTMDRDFEKSFDGIRVINIIDWLLEDF